MKKCWTIYCHMHIESGRRYIGLTSQTMEKRWKNHIYASKSSKGGRWHFPNAIRKYGSETFSHEILEKCSDLEIANLAEQCWIEFYDSTDPKKGFNLLKGGAHTPHKTRRNPWDDPKYREKATKRSQEMMKDPINRQRLALWIKGKSWDYLSEKSKKALNTPEAKVNTSKASKEKYRKPGGNSFLFAFKEKWKDPEFRSKCFSANLRNIRESTKTHCKNGHEFTPENTLKYNGRECRQCRNSRSVSRYLNVRTHCTSGHEYPLNCIRNSHGARLCSICMSHCKHGHEYTPENVKINKRGGRICRTCYNKWHREMDRRRVQKKKNSSFTIS